MINLVFESSPHILQIMLMLLHLLCALYNVNTILCSEELCAQSDAVSNPLAGSFYTPTDKR